MGRGSALTSTRRIGAFRDHLLAGIAYPYVFLDATHCKARVNRRGYARPDMPLIGERNCRRAHRVAPTSPTGRLRRRRLEAARDRLRLAPGLAPGRGFCGVGVNVARQERVDAAEVGSASTLLFSAFSKLAQQPPASMSAPHSS